MTSRYRVEYALKQHRRDGFIEWIKGLTAVPFVLHAGNDLTPGPESYMRTSHAAQRKYAEVFDDVEELINQHIAAGCEDSRLRQLVPSIGYFFTPLPLREAFYVQDNKRGISRRRLVAPSFNDVRMILNSAQLLTLSKPESRAELITFDGDVTLYEDGQSLEIGSPMVSRLIALLSSGIYVGIVTAAGYLSGEHYCERLRGLVDALVQKKELTPEQRSRLLVMGGECNYLFRFDGESGALQSVPRNEWATQTMLNWRDDDCKLLLDTAEKMLAELGSRLMLDNVTEIVRKERSVGIVPRPGHRIPRENLEEIVLNANNHLMQTEVASRVYFCAFNGGADVWVDIGDKRYGVLSLQHYLGGIPSKHTLHVGDQFASVGANDYRARLAACTVWVANPEETLEVLDEYMGYVRAHVRAT